MRNRLMPLMLSAFISIQGYAQSVTEIFYPQYIQGVGTSNPSDDRKVPFACRMALSGLTPNVTYRYYSRFVQDPSVVSNNGQGFYIIANNAGNFTRVTSASLATAGRYGEFTTNASGAFVGWFIVEPSSAIDYAPGTQLYWRIMLNNGAGGGSVASRITSSVPVTVLGFGVTPTTGTGIRSTAVPSFTARNFVMLYDNDLGTGRPVSGTFIESDGTDNNAVTNGYAPFYASNVDAVNQTFGSIIPNNLANGIRRICQYALSDGSSVNCAASTNGVYPASAGGTVSTVNTTGGLTEVAINGSTVTILTPAPVKLLSFTATVMAGNRVSLQWRTAEEVNFKHFEVEKSAGTAFAGIGTVPAKGNGSNYELDDVLTPGTSYYRLKIVDKDGVVKYSPVVAVTKGIKETGLSLFPNPAISNITLTHDEAKPGAYVQVLSAEGLRVFEQAIQPGAVQTRADLSRLATGNYIIAYYNNGSKQVARFRKQ